MSTVRLVSSIVLFCLSAGALVISVLQFCEKGFLWNNAYIYATEEERKKLDRRPYYRQSAVVFLFIAAIFCADGFACLLSSTALLYVSYPLIIGAIVYAIISYNKINKSRK